MRTNSERWTAWRSSTPVWSSSRPQKHPRSVDNKDSVFDAMCPTWSFILYHLRLVLTALCGTVEQHRSPIMWQSSGWWWINDCGQGAILQFSYFLLGRVSHDSFARHHTFISLCYYIVMWTRPCCGWMADRAVITANCCWPCQCCVMAAPHWAGSLPEINHELSLRTGSACLSQASFWAKIEASQIHLLNTTALLLGIIRSLHAFPAQLVDANLALSLDRVQAATHGASWLRGSSVRHRSTVKRCSKLLSERTFWNLWNCHERSSVLLSHDVYQASSDSDAFIETLWPSCQGHSLLPYKRHL